MPCGVLYEDKALTLRKVREPVEAAEAE